MTQNVFLNKHNLTEAYKSRNEALQLASSRFYLSVGAYNNIASLTLTDAVYSLRGSGLMKGRVAYLINRAQRFYSDYERQLKERATRDKEHSRWQFMLDYFDGSYDRVEQDLHSLCLLVSNRINYYHLPHADEGASLAVALIMASTASKVWAKYWEEVKASSGYDFARRYTWADMQPAYRLLNDAIKYFDPHNKVDLVKDANINLTYQAIMCKVINIDNINADGLRALNLNPDVREQVDGMEQQDSNV